MSKFTAKEVREIASDFSKYSQQCYINGVLPEIDLWMVERYKPVKKIIDMTHFIESGIDCEFRDDDAHEWVIASLWNIELLPEWLYYGPEDFKGVRYCRPRMNHKMFHDGGECPLPEGFEVKVYYRDRGNHTSSEYIGHCWGSAPITDNDIIGYEILGLADGWAYPYQESDE